MVIRLLQLHSRHSVTKACASFVVPSKPIAAGIGQTAQRLTTGLDGPGIESRCKVRFSASVQTGPEAHPASRTMGTRVFTGVKRPGCNADHPHHSSAEATNHLEVYRRFSSVTAKACHGMNFTFYKSRR